MTTATIRRLAMLGAVAFALSACATAAPPLPKELVWPAPPEQPRVVFVEELSRSDQFGKKSTFLEDVVLGTDTSKPPGLVKPLMVTTDAKGRVYVADTGTRRVWVFDREKKEVRFLGESSLVGPSGLAVDRRGIVFVSDFEVKRVFGYDESGKVVVAIGKDGEFYSPAGLAIDQASGRLYVADTRRHKIRVYDTDTGEFKFEIADRGGEPGELNFPTHLYIRNRVLYVTDTGNFRVQAFDLSGKFLRKWGELGAKFGQLSRPKGVGVDSDGNVYVVDAAFGNFQIFDDAGELLLFVGSTGGGPGFFRLPAGMHIDAQDRIYVVDQYNARVQVFQYLGQDVELARAAKQANKQ